MSSPSSPAPSSVPATKPQPVVVLGAILAGATALIGGLQTIFAGNKTVVLVLAVCALVVSVLGLVKDQIVKGQVVPLADVAAFVNVDRQLVAGPASNQPIQDAVAGAVAGSVELTQGEGASTSIAPDATAMEPTIDPVEVPPAVAYPESANGTQNVENPPSGAAVAAEPPAGA